MLSYPPLLSWTIHTKCHIVTTCENEVTFSQIKAVLYNMEIRQSKNLASSSIGMSVNAISTEDVKKEDRGFPCQICSGKGHSALNCYNRVILQKFPPSNTKAASTITAALALIYISQATILCQQIYRKIGDSVWYPDSKSHEMPNTYRKPREIEVRKIFLLQMEAQCRWLILVFYILCGWK